MRYPPICKKYTIELSDLVITKILHAVKTTIVKLRNLFILAAIAGLFACEGPEGPVGPAGPKGDTGIAGPTGQTGPAGQDGQDGQNGNSNVTVISLLSTNITWLEGEYLGRPANIFSLETDKVNDDIMDHGTVLGYCYMNEGWYSLPLTWEDIDGASRMYILHSYSPNTITLFAYQTSGVLDPDLVTEYRFMLITDNTVMGAKGISPENDILMKLEKAGVDVRSYDQVCDYFGIKR